MKMAVLCKGSITVCKIGFTKVELQAIIDGNPKEVQFDKFHNAEFRFIIKRLKNDVEKKP